MSPRSKKEEYQEMAALYALGVLTQNEARAFEDVVANDTKELTEELAEFEFVAANLGFAAPEYAPPLSVRDRLLMEIANTSQSSSEDFHLPVDPQMRFSPVFSLYADQGEWLEIGAGLTAKTLFVDQARGIVTSLVRMAPGGSLPPHRHRGDEQFYVLEGDCNVHGTRLGPGDFHRAAAGSVHESTYTVEGTTFLLIAPADYEILQPAVH